MKTMSQLVWSLVVAAVVVVATLAVALALIPQLSLNAAIRGGTIAFLAMAGARLGMWWNLRRKERPSA